MELEAWPYFNAGRWVVDCPNGCGNAWIVTPGEKKFTCWVPAQRMPDGRMTEEVGCRAQFALKWPAEPAAAMRTPAPGAKTASQLAYEAEAQREHEAQHTDHDGEPGDGQEKTNALAAEAIEKGQADA